MTEISSRGTRTGCLSARSVYEFLPNLPVVVVLAYHNFQIPVLSIVHLLFSVPVFAHSLLFRW